MLFAVQSHAMLFRYLLCGVVWHARCVCVLDYSYHRQYSLEYAPWVTGFTLRIKQACAREVVYDEQQVSYCLCIHIVMQNISLSMDLYKLSIDLHNDVVIPVFLISNVWCGLACSLCVCVLDYSYHRYSIVWNLRLG